MRFLDVKVRKREASVLSGPGYHPVGYEIGPYDPETYLFHRNQANLFERLCKLESCLDFFKDMT